MWIATVPFCRGQEIIKSEFSTAIARLGMQCFHSKATSTQPPASIHELEKNKAATVVSLSIIVHEMELPIEAPVLGPLACRAA